MKKIIIIPARLNSSRLPNKVLLDLDGKTVVQRVYEQCLLVPGIDAVYIATDSSVVYDSCISFTSNIFLTSPDHESGTDRIAEVSKLIDTDVIINVQGDEPFISPTLIEQIAKSFDIDSSLDIVSAIHKIELVEDLKNPNVVKVTIDKNDMALYFSRSIIPHHRDMWDTLLNHHITVPDTLKFYRHLGIYGYKKEFLLNYASMETSYLERLEKLEQLRALENGFKIKMIHTDHNSIGIDTQADYEKALSFIKASLND